MNDAATSLAATPRYHQRRAATWAGALAAVAAAAVITGCSAAPSQPAASASSASAAPTTPVAAPSTVASTPATPAAAPATSAAAQPAATPAGAVPVLGQLAGVFAQGQGFGQAQPAKIFNGGDPTGLVTNITWQSWGGRKAIGSGTAEYVGPNQSVATGTQKPATVVAFHLGTCDGKLMYQAVEWYFPGEGQAFDPTHYENVCTGSYVPAS
jgi:hypothetical protein